MRVKRDNSSFRTRFTTVMISSFFFHLVSLFRVWLSSSGLMERSKMCTLILHYFSITRFVLLLSSGQCPPFRCLPIANCQLPITNYQLHVVDAFSILWSSSYLRLRNKLHLHLLMYTQSRINWQTNTTNKKPCLPCCRSSY